MSRVSLGPSAAPTLPIPAVTPRRLDAVSVLTCYLILLMAIPAALVVGSFGGAGAPATLFAVVMLGWYLVARTHPDLAPDTDWQPIRVAVLLFACGILAAYVAANRQALDTLQKNGADRGLIMLAGWLGVALLAADGIDRPERLDALLRRVVIGVTGMAALGIVEFLTGLDLSKYAVIPGLTIHKPISDLMNRQGLLRVVATASQPLELMAVLAIGLPLALHLARFAPPGRKLRRWLQVAVIAGATPLTVSRSAVLCLVVIPIALLPTWPVRDRRRAYLVLLATPGLIWLVKPNLLTTLSGLFVHISGDNSAASRARALALAGQYIAAHPWFGQGFDTFFPQTYFFVDDQYLTTLIETGAIGLAALVGLFLTGWFTARRARAAATDPAERDRAQSLAASLATSAVCFASFDVLAFPIATGLTFLLLGCVGAAWRMRGRGAGGLS